MKTKLNLAKEEAVKLINKCRDEIDMESSIAFDPRNEHQLMELAKVCALFSINEKIDYASEIDYTGDVITFQAIKREIEKYK